MRRLILMILGMNIIVYAVMFYYYAGTYVFIGEYEGIPVAQYRGDPYALLVGYTMMAYGLFLYYAASRSRSVGDKRLLLGGLLVLSLPVFMVSAGVVYHDTSTHFYGGCTDAYTIQVEAAKTLLEGLNPYTADYHDVLHNYTINGVTAQPTWLYRDPDPPYTGEEVVGYVHVYNYPAAALLYYLPPVVLGFSPILWDAVIYGLGLGLFYARMRSGARDMYALIIASGGLVLATMPMMYNGLPGWLTPLLIAVMYPGNPWLSGAMLGWIVSYRPYTGVYALFYLLAYHREGYDSRRLLASAMLTGVLVNAPFLLADPRLFFSRILLPLTSNLYPYDGFGLSSLYFLGIVIPKHFHLLLVAGLIVFGLLFFYRYYEGYRLLVLLYPLIVLFAYYRPLYGYYLWAPLYPIVAYATGFYRGLGINTNEGIQPYRLGLLGIGGILVGVTGSIYTEMVGSMMCLDMFLVAGLFLVMVAVHLGNRGVPIRLPPKTTTLLTTLLVVGASIGILVLLPQIYRIDIYWSRNSPIDAYTLAASHTLLVGGNPYLGGLEVPVNKTIYSIYGFRRGFHLVLEGPANGWDWVYADGYTPLEYYAGPPAPLLFGLATEMLGSSIVLGASIIAVLTIYALRRPGLPLLVVLSTGFLYYVFLPKTSMVYGWILVLVLLERLVENKICRGIVLGLIAGCGLGGLIYAAYRLFTEGFDGKTVTVALIVLGALVAGPAFQAPLLVTARMLLPVAGSTSALGLTIPYLLSRYVLHTPCPGPIHPPLVLVALVSTALLLRGGKWFSASMLAPLLLCPEPIAQPYSGASILVDANELNDKNR